MTDEQQRALDALASAHKLYRLADEHRSALMGLCLELGASPDDIAQAVGSVFERNPDHRTKGRKLAAVEPMLSEEEREALHALRTEQIWRVETNKPLSPYPTRMVYVPATDEEDAKRGFQTPVSDRRGIRIVGCRRATENDLGEYLEVTR